MADHEVTAELRNWLLLGNVEGKRWAIGDIFNDSKNRFKDGTEVRTSSIVEIKGDIIVTRNSVYRLVGEGGEL